MAANLDRALKDAADEGARRARSTVSVDDGETRDSISVEKIGDGWQIKAGGAAGYLEFGTRYMSAEPFLGANAERAAQSVLPRARLER